MNYPRLMNSKPNNASWLAHAHKGVRVCVLLLCVLGCAAGCQRSLLAPTDSRTPFDAYDSVRGQSTPQQVDDEVGQPKVNLRQRLAPKN